MVGGLIVAFPYITYQFWCFVRPALKDAEKKSIKGLGFASSLLFFLGVAFGYWGIVPLSLQFLGGYELGDVAARIAVMSYVKTVTTIAFAAGLIFQLPIFVYFLSRRNRNLIIKEVQKARPCWNLNFAAIITS